MDANLDQRWRLAESPFHEDCLHLTDCIQISQLRLFLIDIVDFLQSNSSADTLVRFDDWHEHDGFVTEASAANWNQLEQVLIDDNSLFDTACDDDYVRCAVYPIDCSFLLRYWFIDDDANPPDVWANFDICGSSALVRGIRSRAPASLATKLAIVNSKEYFDRVYAG